MTYLSFELCWVISRQHGDRGWGGGCVHRHHPPATTMAGYYMASSCNNNINSNGRLLHGFLIQQHQQQQRQVITRLPYATTTSTTTTAGYYTASLVQIRRVRGWFTPWKRAFTRWLGFLSVHLRVKYLSKRVRYAHIKIPARTFYRLVSLVIKIGVRWPPYLTAPANSNNSAISVTFGRNRRGVPI